MEYLAFRSHFWDVGTFWVTVAVVLFLVVFGRRIANGIFGMVDARSQAIRDELDEAKKLRREAETMLADAQKRQAEAVRAAREMVEHARSRAERLASDLAEQAAETRARRERMMRDRIRAAEANAVRDVRNAAATLAVEAARRVLREAFDAEQDASAIDSAIEAIPNALGGRRAA